MLVKMRYNFSHVGLVEIPSSNENSLRIGALQIIDVVIEVIQGSFCVCVRGNTNYKYD